MIEDHDLDVDIDTSDISSALSYIESGHSKIERSFENLMAYIKTFDISEFESIYCEREWRSTTSYNFKLEDIAIIILPRKQSKTNFYQKFLKETNLPKEVVVACWEDLIEH